MSEQPTIWVLMEYPPEGGPTILASGDDPKKLRDKAIVTAAKFAVARANGQKVYGDEVSLNIRGANDEGQTTITLAIITWAEGDEENTWEYWNWKVKSQTVWAY